MGSLIRFVAIGISVVVVLGFAMFASNEADKGSQAQQNKLEHELGHAPNDLIAPNAHDEALSASLAANIANPSTTTTEMAMAAKRISEPIAVYYRQPRAEP